MEEVTIVKPYLCIKGKFNFKKGHYYDVELVNTAGGIYHVSWVHDEGGIAVTNTMVFYIEDIIEHFVDVQKEREDKIDTVLG